MRILHNTRITPNYFGCILGRYAGRIAGAKFELDGEVFSLSKNDGVNHLHGGIEGFNKKVWKIKSFIQEDTEAGVIMEYFSQDCDEGYPGNLWVTVKYILDRDNKLRIIYDAVTDKNTPVNLSNHSYFNLGGFASGDILKHTLQNKCRSPILKMMSIVYQQAEFYSVEGSPMGFFMCQARDRD